MGAEPKAPMRTAGTWEGRRSDLELRRNRDAEEEEEEDDDALEEVWGASLSRLRCSRRREASSEEGGREEATGALLGTEAPDW